MSFLLISLLIILPLRAQDFDYHDQRRKMLIQHLEALEATMAAENMDYAAQQSFKAQKPKYEASDDPNWVPQMLGFLETMRLYVISEFTAGAIAKNEIREIIEAGIYDKVALYYLEDLPLPSSVARFYQMHPERLQAQKMHHRYVKWQTDHFVRGTLPIGVSLSMESELDRKRICSFLKIPEQDLYTFRSLSRSAEGITLTNQEGKKTFFPDPAQPAVTAKAPAKQPKLSATADAAPAPARAEKTAQKRSDVDKPTYRGSERPDDFALVVGVEKYSDLPDALYASRDAEAVRDHLLALGFPQRNVIFLSGQKAGYKSIEKYLEHWLARNVRPESRVVFYFSGHGAPDPSNGKAFLLPWDGDPAFLESTGYPVGRLYEKLGALKAKQVLVALDACFSGAGARSVMARGARPLVNKIIVEKAPAKIAVLAAASENQITSTLEDEGHGIFTYHLLKGLNSATGAVSAKKLFDYLSPRVQDEARRQNREQVPVLRGADFDFRF